MVQCSCGGQCGGFQYSVSLCGGGICEECFCGANVLCNATLPFWSKWFNVVVGANMVGSNIETLYVVGANVRIVCVGQIYYVMLY